MEYIIAIDRVLEEWYVKAKKVAREHCMRQYRTAVTKAGAATLYFFHHGEEVMRYEFDTIEGGKVRVRAVFEANHVDPVRAEKIMHVLHGMNDMPLIQPKPPKKFKDKLKFLFR